MRGMVIWFLALVSKLTLAAELGHDCDLNNDGDAFHEIKTGSDSNGTNVGFYGRFNIAYYDTYKVISNNVTSQRLGLYCVGTKIPKFDDEKLKVDRWISIPVKTVGSFDRPAVAWLEMLGLEKAVVAVEDPDSITSPCTKENFKVNPPKTFESPEVASGLDLIFTTGVSKVNWTEMLSVHLSYNNEVDESPLNRAQWIHVISAFFNMEREASIIYDRIIGSYRCLSHNFKHLTNKQQIEIVQKDKGKWRLIQGKGWPDLAVSSGGYSLHIAEPDDKNISKDEIIDVLFDANSIIDLSKDDNAKEDLMDLKAYKESNYSKPIGRSSGDSRDWTESAVPRPDLVLEDLINIVYPTFNTSFKTRWLTRMDSNSPSSLPSCKTDIQDRFETINCEAISGGYKEISSRGPIRRNNALGEPDDNTIAGTGRVIGIIIGILASFLVIATIAYILYRRYVTRNQPVTIHKLKRKENGGSYHEANTGLLTGQQHQFTPSNA